MSENLEDLRFQDIYTSFRPRVHRYLARLVSESEAEDLTQEVFVKVSQALKDFRGESKLSTWVYRIATNVAMDKLRSRSFLRIVKNKVSIDSSQECGRVDRDKIVNTNTDTNGVNEPPPIDQQLIKKEMNECIRDFIESLPGTYKSVVVLSELEDLKNKEIAEILGISLDTVKIRLHRAREKLKKKLEQGCTFYHNEENVLSCDLKEAYK